MIERKKKAAWVLIAVASVSSFEGLRQIAYEDPVGIPTICFGETHGVKMGDVATLAQCQDMLADSLEKANQAVDACVVAPLPDARRAALVSFTYNVGGTAFCKSTLVRKINSGDISGGCNELPRWNKATKAGVPIVLPGLTKRRAEERKLCLGIA